MVAAGPRSQPMGSWPPFQLSQIMISCAARDVESPRLGERMKSKQIFPGGSGLRQLHRG